MTRLPRGIFTFFSFFSICSFTLVGLGQSSPCSARPEQQVPAEASTGAPSRLLLVQVRTVAINRQNNTATLEFLNTGQMAITAFLIDTKLMNCDRLLDEGGLGEDYLNEVAKIRLAKTSNDPWDGAWKAGSLLTRVISLDDSALHQVKNPTLQVTVTGLIWADGTIDTTDNEIAAQMGRTINTRRNIADLDKKLLSIMADHKETDVEARVRGILVDLDALKTTTQPDAPAQFEVTINGELVLQDSEPNSQQTQQRIDAFAKILNDAMNSPQPGRDESLETLLRYYSDLYSINIALSRTQDNP